MIDPTDEFDREMRALARAARGEIESGVDTDRAFVAASGQAESRRVADDVSAHRGPSRIVGLAAAAAVVGMIAGGLVMGLRGDDAAVVRTNTVPPTVSPSPVPSVSSPAPPPTSATPASDPVGTEVSTTVDPGNDIEVRTIAVDASNPPPLIEPTPFVSIPLRENSNGSRIEVAAFAERVVVFQPNTSTMTVVGPGDDQITDIATEVDLSTIAPSPGGVVYGLAGPVFDADNQNMPRGIRFVGIPLFGPRQGQVVSESEVDLLPYLEIPIGVFGNDVDGIVDRLRLVNESVISHVDELGEPLAYAWEQEGGPPPLLTSTPFVGRPVRPNVETATVAIVGQDLAWDLSIARSPSHGGSYTGPPPAMPTSGQRVIYTDTIGVALTPDTDFGPSAMPVIAILESDGSGRWVRLPDEWSVAASDVWGTTLMRTSNGVLELARLDDALPPKPQVADQATFAVPFGCVEGQNCTQLVSMTDGTIVAFEPADETFVVLDPTGETIQNVVAVDLPEGSRFPNLVSIGPDDAAYLTVFPAGRGDPLVDLLAVPLTGPNAGMLSLVEAGLDGSGDTDLVPTRTGLASVGCCGFDRVRPDPERPVIPWVGGGTLDGPVFDITLSDNGYDLNRSDPDGTTTTFPLPTVVSTALRGMPQVVPTDDGGALLAVYQQVDNASYVVRFRTTWPRFGIDPADVFYLGGVDAPDVQLLEPAGTVIVAEGAVLARRSLDDVGDAGWPGRTEVDFDAGTRHAPGLDEFIDANQPGWARSPLSLAFQLSPRVGPNEQFSAVHDEGADTLTTTVTGFLDDSVNGVQTVWPLALGDDGLYRVGVGQYGQRCQPNRGHQDYRSEPCV